MPWWVHALAPGAVAAAVGRRVPTLAGRSLVLVSGGARPVVAYAAPTSMAAGIRRGLSLEHARARCDDLLALPYGPRPEAALEELLSRTFGMEAIITSSDSSEELRLGPRDDDQPPSPKSVRDWFARVLGVRASVAVAAHPVAARICAHCAGLVPELVGPGNESCLAPAPLSHLPWLPPRPVGVLARRWAVFTVGDLAELPAAFVLKMLGRDGLEVVEAVRGGTHADEAAARVRLCPPTNEAEVIRKALLRAVDEAWGELVSRGVAARCLQLHLRRASLAPTVRFARFDPHAEDPLTLGHAACRLLRGAWSRRAVESVEVRLSPGIRLTAQPPLFPQARWARLGRLGEALATLRHRYGPTTLCRASLLASTEE